MSSSGSFITQVDSVTITAVSAQHLPATQNRPTEQAFLPRSLYSHGAPASPSLVSSITTLLSISVFLVWRELNKWTLTFQTGIFSLSTLLSTWSTSLCVTIIHPFLTQLKCLPRKNISVVPSFELLHSCHICVHSNRHMLYFIGICFW